MHSPSLSMGWALLATVAIILLATLAVGAWWPTNSTGKWEYTPVSAIVKTGLPQNPLVVRSLLYNKLALQPEADRFRRRLGQRFLALGREVSVSLGTVSIGADRHAVRMVRTQDEAGEQVALSLNGGPLSLTWNGTDGARSSGNSATGNLRALVERLALDSPDQFIQAQLRGASYYSVARNVQPSGAAGSVDYKGSVWNVVRITEPVYISQAAKPQSSSRLYFINAVNGMIDKVISQENGETITAELFSWDNRDNEVVPSRIVWKRDHQVIMEFLLASVTHTPKQ